MSNGSKIELEFIKYEQSNQWREIYQEVRNADDVFNLSLDQARLSFNSKYNRYRDILPYDHSRVKLKNILETDYINANYVNCDLANRKYILAQAPLKSTCEHFWQMIWEQKTKGIVMLNRLYEKGALKCEMYYPNVDEESTDSDNCFLEFGKFRLNYLSEKPFNDFSIRTIECENMEQKEKRIIYHCHFTNWPDFGEPEYTNTFLKFLEECNKLEIFDSELNGPSVVHCSAGVGRSGTFILVDSMLQLHKKYGEETPIEALELLKKFRRCRMGLIQTHQQLKFAYMAIIDGINQIKNIGQLNVSVAEKNEPVELDEVKIDNKSENEDEDDDDFYENEAENNLQKKNRPDTAKRVKRITTSKKTQNHIKNLREIQLKNSQINNIELYTIQTAINKKEDETKNDTKEQQNGKLIDEEGEEEEEEERPFAINRSDVQTVKVNKVRKSVEPLNLNCINKIKREPIKPCNQQELNSIQSNQTKDTPTEPKSNQNSSQKSKSLSDKDQRISNLVSSMREKQIKHEKRKKFFNDIKPILIGGTVLIGGLIIHQIYKNFFSK